LPDRAAARDPGRGEGAKTKRLGSRGVIEMLTTTRKRSLGGDSKKGEWDFDALQKNWGRKSEKRSRACKREGTSKSKEAG